jgi:hypothetical protein
MKQLIDRFNAMLQDVAALGEFAHVRYIDLRHTLTDPDIKILTSIGCETASMPGLRAIGALKIIARISKTELQGNDFYQKWWENELHPTAFGFNVIAKRFHQELQMLG